MSQRVAPSIDADAAELRRKQAMTPTVTEDAEFRCDVCDARCTRGPDGTEYGHAYKCPERPASLPESYSRARWHGGDR